MTKVKGNTEVSVNGQFDIHSVLGKLTKELSALKAITDSPFKTKGNMGQFGELKNINDIKTLIKARAVLKRMKTDYDESSMELGLTTVPVWEHDGHDFDALEHDIKLRMSIIQYDARKKELEAMVEEAKGFMTKEDQKAIFLAKMAKVVSA